MKKKVSHFFMGAISSFIAIFVWIFLVSFSVFCYFAYRKQAAAVYSSVLCMSDYLDFLNGSYLFRLLFVPLTIFIVSFICDNHQTLNSIIRYKKKYVLIFLQQIKAASLSVLFSLFTLGISSFFAALFSTRIHNWNEQESYFCIMRGYCLDNSITEVLCWNFYEILICLVFYSFLIIFLNTILSKGGSFFAVIVLLGINAQGFLQYEISNLTHGKPSTIQYVLISNQIIYCIILPALILCLCAFSLKTAGRKEYYIP